ncbi:hypothetical protein ACQJBY_005684 [Aegilops geniculata]
MMSKKLHVFDPLSGRQGPSMQIKDEHELIAWKLHHALFHCLNKYYAGWPTEDGYWSTIDPVVASKSFAKEDTGACILHIARHYDRIKLKIPLTKYNVNKFKKQALHECLKLQGNTSTLASHSGRY